MKVLLAIMARELAMLAAPALSIVFPLLGALGLFIEGPRSAWRCGTAWRS